MKKTRIVVDMDGVIADLLSEWVSRYNKLYDDNLKSSEAKIWNWHTICKKECGEQLYSILDDPELFESLPVIEGSQEVLRKLSNTYELFVCTAAWNKLNIPPKANWLRKHFPFINEKNYVFTQNKSIVLAECLIDDKPENLESFYGDQKLLFDAPHNQDEIRFERMKNWNEVASYFGV